MRPLKYIDIHKVRDIDRSEIINHIYYYKKGNLELKKQHYNLNRWNEDELKDHISYLFKLYKKGGYFYGMFHDSKLIGIAALECEFIGKKQNQLQLVFFHIHKDYKNQGIGKKLMEKAKEKAKNLGAKSLTFQQHPP